MPEVEVLAANWDYEHAYPGGPMVAVKGFVRPLYPPDASPGKFPSEDGPDCIGAKRCVSRGGRWLWQKFDDSYSNAFAHGSGGNVGETGMAGFQRQMKLDDTGWMGEPTYNALRSARIPTGLPNAGQPLMDKTAANLFNDAWAMFKGPKPSTKTVRQAALDCAIEWIGYVESGTNVTVFGDWYGMNGAAWCAMFNTYQYEVGARSITGKDSPTFVQGSRYAYVPYIVNDARAGRNGLTITKDPIPGDLVCYDWQRDGTFDHTGLFEKWQTSGSAFNAIEGNTSTANQSNGGQVMRRTRTMSDATIVFCRVAEP